jgi:hypothetical protein
VGSDAGSVIRIASSTIAGNGAADGGNLYVDAGSVLELTNTIVAGATGGGNCDGVVTSFGNNLADGSDCVLDDPTDIENADPDLEPLADNGGPTATLALGPASDAIDAGAVTCRDPDGIVLGTDQRGPGFPRRTDGDLDGDFRCDIGAFEVAPEPGAATVALAAWASLAALARRARSRVP